MKQRIVVISGPTSTGKSEIAVELAKRFDGEIVSADSMQVYRGMNIGTGKLSAEKMQGIPHYLIDIIDPKDDFNVSIFREKASEAIEYISSRGKLPIIVGGTGFYIRSLLYIDSPGDPGKDPEYRQQLSDTAAKKGISPLFERLKVTEPVYCGRITHNDQSRIIRALEYNHTTGLKYSDYCDSMVSDEPIYDAQIFYLDCDRSILYSRMDERGDSMIMNGLEGEVRSLMSHGLDLSYNSMNGIGYKEMFLYLSGKMSKKDAVRQIKSRAHHYAVRQSTWFRKQKGSVVIDCSDTEKASKRISELISL